MPSMYQKFTKAQRKALAKVAKKQKLKLVRRYRSRSGVKRVWDSQWIFCNTCAYSRVLQVWQGRWSIVWYQGVVANTWSKAKCIRRTMDWQLPTTTWTLWLWVKSNAFVWNKLLCTDIAKKICSLYWWSSIGLPITVLPPRKQNAPAFGKPSMSLGTNCPSSRTWLRMLLVSNHCKTHYLICVLVRCCSLGCWYNTALNVHNHWHDILVCVGKALGLRFWRWANLKPIQEFLREEVANGYYKP